jgi:hypothetical protein
VNHKIAMQNKKKPLSIDENEYLEFVKWLDTKPDGFSGFTYAQSEFAKQMFEFLVDYPSFRKKVVRSYTNQVEIFSSIQQFLKSKEK